MGDAATRVVFVRHLGLLWEPPCAKVAGGGVAMRWNLSAVASCAIVCAGVFGAPGGINSAPITIGDNSNASPYPSQIVIGSPLTITNISVGLRGLSHARLSDLSVLLVSPTGKKIMLLANAPGHTFR